MRRREREDEGLILGILLSVELFSYCDVPDGRCDVPDGPPAYDRRQKEGRRPKMTEDHTTVEDPL